jgi:hypothetical protein
MNEEYSRSAFHNISGRTEHEYFWKMHPKLASRMNQYTAKMRIGCSLLNYDLWENLHVIASPKLNCIMNENETADHFFTRCPCSYMLIY